MRAELGQNQVRNRYLSGVARDLAENGIEYEVLMIASGKQATPHNPHVIDVGKFARREGYFKVFSRAQGEGSIEVVSQGAIRPGRDSQNISKTIRAVLHKAPSGKYFIAEWNENLKSSEE